MSSFEQTMIIPRCYIPSFVKIGRMVLDKIFLGFLTYVYVYGHGGHLGHVTSSRSLNLISLYLKAYMQNLVQNGPLVSEKSQF